MKKRIALLILSAALLVAAAGCELYTGITVSWTIDGYLVTGSPVRVTYTVQNVGQVDLQGVNLKVGVDTGVGFTNTAWTSSFSLAKGEVRHATIDVPTDGYAPIGATVLSIDMDKPSS